MVKAIFIRFDLAVSCVRNVVLAPHGWFWFTAFATSCTAWVKDHNIARICISDIDVTKVIEIDELAKLTSSNDILATLAIIDKARS